MTTRNFEHLFRPKSIALFGASDRPHSVGVRPEDLQLRFFRVVHAFQHSQLARFTQFDYDREMAFIATARAPSLQS